MNLMTPGVDYHDNRTLWVVKLLHSQLEGGTSLISAHIKEIF